MDIVDEVSNRWDIRNLALKVALFDRFVVVLFPSTGY